MKVSMSEVANRNARDGWVLNRTTEGTWKLRRKPWTYLDFPVPWFGLVWPVSEVDSDAKWHYEIRSYIDGTLLESGTEIFFKAFQAVHSKN